VITKEVPWDKVSSYGVVVTDKEGRITQFQEKPKQEEALSNFISTGIYIFEPEVIDLIPSGVEFDIGSQLFPLLAEKGMPFYAQGRPFNWLDIGSVSDYWEVLQNVLTGEVNHMDVPGIQIEPGLWTGLNTSIDWRGTTIKGPVYIGSGVKIEAGATIIGPTWIGHGSHICEGAEIVRSVLFEYTRVLNDVTLHEMIVFKDYSIDRAGEMKHSSDYSSDEWLNARDRRRSRRKEGVDETDTTLEKISA
jgi:mannose-1-phosphate guanylyltransferase